MDDRLPIYNSRIIKIYLEYIGEHYPEIDIDSILEGAEIAEYEVEDPACWFNQDQVDRFYEILVAKTGNPDISRNAGRYTISTIGIGPIKQYTLGLMSLASIYLLMGKVYAVMSRGSDVKAKKLGVNRVEITCTPKPGVNEKPYQCENRIGSFESLAKLFTKRFARIEHPLCFHRGDKCCRYIITWEKTFSLFWRQIRGYSLLLSVVISSALFFIMPAISWLFFVLSCILLNILLSYFSEYLENKELRKSIKIQGDAAENLIKEMDIRHNNALLVQEIGQATSRILDIDKLVNAVISAMEKRLDFDRGMVMLAQKDKTRLAYTSGYGYSKEQEEVLRQTEFHLDDPESRGVFVVAFKKQKPYLVSDIEKNGKKFSKRSYQLAKKMGVQSLICVPLIYEKESMGILAVDNVRSKRLLNQSDINLLMGVGSQAAVGIANAMSFQKLHESEKKYRELVENANSIILRRDIKGNITFFNEFAQKFFGFTEDEILGRNVKGTISPAGESTKHDPEKITELLRQDPDQHIVSENKNILRNGKTVWIAWTYKPIFDSNGDFREILSIGNDITNFRRAAEEKKCLEARLQRAEKMEAIGMLAGGVAHDLNNVLSGIVSYPELLLMDLPQESRLRKPILTIQKSGERAAAIVQDLLTLSRRGVVATEVVNLRKIVSEYLQSPEHKRLLSYHPKVKVETLLESNLLNISGSPVHLSKTVMNLLYNAAESMPDGGRAFISLENRYIDRPISSYDAVDEGDYVVLTVSDTGIGIAPEDIERIFEPFYTKKVMGRSGTGLGMAVVWGTVGYGKKRNRIGHGCCMGDGKRP
jgi:PAS domain S-box-containing protein